MGRDRPPSYSRSSRDRESSRRSREKNEYRSMTRSPSPVGQPSKSSRRKYSRSSSSSSSSSLSDKDRRSQHKGNKHGGSSPILLQSSPERGNSASRSHSKWLESSPNFQPMTPPSPPNTEKPSPDPPVPTMESQPIPSFQREDYRSSDATPRGFARGFREGFNQPFGNNYFQGGNSSFVPPEANSQHNYNMNNPNHPSGMGHGPPMVGAGPPPPNLVGSGPHPNMVGNGPPPNMASAGPVPNMMGGLPMPNASTAGTSTPNMAASWESPHGNYPYPNTEFPPLNTGAQPHLTGFKCPEDVTPPHPIPSSNADSSKPSAVEQELVQQKRTLAIQREEYFKKKISLTRDLKSLKDKKRELLKDTSKGSDRLLKENMKLQDEIEQKLKSLDSVIEMLTHIIGDKDEIDQLLKETARRSESPKKRKRSRSKSPSRSKSDKKRSSSPRKRSLSPRKRSPSPRKRSASPLKRFSPRKRSASPPKRSSSPHKRASSPHVNVVHYDPELHWCSVCNVFPRSATVYLVHLHSEQHKRAVKDKKEKEKPEEEFAPWRVNGKRELSPPVYKNAPSRRVPIRGVPFLIPATAWYCSMCKMWLGDLELANRHLRGEKHADSYLNYVTDNPHWEVDWLRDRTRAYERNSEARNRQQDYKEEKYSRRESKTKDVPELSSSDVSKLEERLMALIAAKNAANSKEGSSKDKDRGRSSSRSDASYSSSDDEKKDRKKKRKGKKKKKSRESREKSAEVDDHKKGKHRDPEEDPEAKKARRRWDDDGKGDKRSSDRGGGSDRRDKDDDKRNSERGGGSDRRDKDDDKRNSERGGGSDRRDRDDKADKNEARDRVMNAWRGRSRGQDRSRFDNRRLINRNPLWRPSVKDRIAPSNVEPKEKLAVGRNVFGLAASEYYGPEAPPRD